MTLRATKRIPLLCVLCVLCGQKNLSAAPSRAPLEPFLENHCYECHNDETQKGELNLHDLDLTLDSEAQLHLWAYVHDRIQSGEMPPEKKPRPDPPEAKQFLSDLGRELHVADKAQREVVQRRLNRVEYENTIRDLLHIDIELRDSLPEDAVKDGFDNIGAALAVSTEQMQACLAAAELALDAAIVDRNDEAPVFKTITKRLSSDSKNVASKLKSGQWRRTGDDFIITFIGAGYVPTDVISAPEGGWYDMEFTCRTHRSDGKPMTVVIHRNNDRLRTSGILGFYQAFPENTVIRDRIRLAKGDKLKPLPFDLPYVKPDPDYDGRGLAIGPITLKGPIVDSWPPKSHAVLLGDIDPDAATAADAETVLKNFLPRAFRRPVADADIKPFLDLVAIRLDEGRPFLDALKVGLQAALCSPDFLYLSEPIVSTDSPSGTRQSSGLKSGDFSYISDLELASRISYFLWSSMPDDELLSLGARSRLSDPDILRKQVERLLQSPKAERFTANFTGQWLKLREIDFTTPDNSLYPEFDAHLQDSMIGESHRFFEEVLKNDLPVQSFVDSDFSILNERLARHYGIRGIENFELQRVTLPAGSPRGGVLTQGSVLKVTANGTNTSPVMRGVWVLDNILGQPSPPPPAGVPAIEPDIRGATTIREQLDKHRDSEKCASCHRKIDPPGFALESFDPIGGYRERYRSMGEGTRPEVEVHGKAVRYRIGLPVDPSGVTPGGQPFAGIHEFKQRLLEDEPAITRCLTEKLLTYALGRSLGFSDRPEVARIVATVAKKNHGLRSLIHEIVQSEAFRSP